MNVIGYIDKRDPQSERLTRTVALFLTRERLRIHRSIDSLRRKLRRPKRGDDVLLISLSSRERLSEVVGQRELLSDMRIVLVLPDRDQETIALGHLLRPRMVSYRDSDFLDVAAVLTRMMERKEQAF